MPGGSNATPARNVKPATKHNAPSTESQIRLVDSFWGPGLAFRLFNSRQLSLMCGLVT